MIPYDDGKTVCLIVPCYNEAGNIGPLYERVTAAFATIPEQRYVIQFMDNASTDETVAQIKSLIARDPRVRLIVNARNFGVGRSGLHGFLAADGDAVLHMVADLQDPPEMIPDFVKHWRNGYKVVIGVKPASQEAALMFSLRRAYYKLLALVSEVPQIQNFTGFGLYDREVVEQVRATGDRNPYFRGLIADLGYPRVELPFTQPRRERGVSKNNFYALYDQAMLGFTSHSKVPLRLATMSGFVLSGLSLLAALGYLAAKLLFWNHFQANTAPILIAVFFFAAVQLFFIGLQGEYIGAILTQVTKRPLVIEKERMGFDGASPRT